MSTYPHGHGTALATLLDRQGVRKTKVGTPVTSSDGQHRQLGDDDGGANGRGDFLGRLDSQTDVTLAVANDDNGLETRALTGTGLFLDRLDLESKRLAIILGTRSQVLSYLHHLILELGQEKVDNLVLLDGQRVQVDLLHRLDLALLDETTELGDGLPFLLLVLVGAPTRSTSSTSTASVSAPVSARTKSASTGTSSSSVSHPGNM